MYPTTPSSMLNFLLLLILPLVSAQKPKVTQLDQFAPGTFLENLAPRTNGHVLVTEIGLPRLWSFDGTGATPPFIVHNFTDHTSMVGITATTSDIFAVIVGNATLGSTGIKIQNGSFAIMKVDFSEHEDPVVSKIADLPEAGLLNGLAYIPATQTVLAADSVLGAVWGVGLDTGETSIVIDDRLMKVCPHPFFDLGINGIRYSEQNSTVYFSNSACGTLNKIEVNPNGTAAGQSSVVSSLGGSMDDFAIGHDGTFYIADAGQNAVARIDPNGDFHTIAGSLNSTEIAEPTSMQFGKTAQDRAKGRLYVTTAGGLAAPINGSVVVGAQFIAIDLKTWGNW